MYKCYVSINTSSIIYSLSYILFSKIVLILYFFRQMSKDLVDTKSTLEKEHKLVVLQMQAINELWKKVRLEIIVLY